MIKKIILLSSFILFVAIQEGKTQNLLQTIDSMMMDSRYPEVIRLVDDQLTGTVSPEIKIVLENKKAESLISLGQLDRSESLLNSISEECKNMGMSSYYAAITGTNKGFLYLTRGRNDLADEEISKALKIFEAGGNLNTLDVARALNMQGLIYMNAGKYNQAREQMLRALDIRREKAGTMKELIAASYNDLGLVYSQTDDNKAIEYYHFALDLYREIHGESHPKIAIVTTNLGILNRELGKNSDAIDNFDAALKIWEGVYPGPHANKAFLLFNLGETYVKLGALSLATDNYNKALSMYRDVYGNRHPEIANILNALGNIEKSQGRFFEALNYYQTALVANSYKFNATDLMLNPGTDEYFNGNVLLYSLLFKAEALESQYFGKTLRFSELQLALKSLVLCDSLIDKLRQRSLNESDKLALGSLSGEVYADGVRIANIAAINAFVKKPYRDLAFFFAEKSKGAVLQEAISDTNAKSYAGISADMIEKERELKTAMANVSRKITQMAGEVEMTRLRDSSFTLGNQYKIFIAGLEKKYPEYFNLKFNVAAPSVQQLMETLDDSTAIISYFIEERNSRLYVFFISNNQYRIIDKPLPPDLNRLITGFRNSLYYDEIMSVKITGSQLYSILIPSMPSRIKNLVIIPTDRLSLIPFEALISKYDETESIQNIPFLVMNFNVHYEFSAGLLLQKTKKLTLQNPSIFLCAPINFPVSDHLSDLPGTQAEVYGISHIFSDKKLTTALYTGMNASETEIKSSDLKNFSFLHLATHGLVDEINPELSCVYLQPSLPDEDGRLYAGEIYNLNLNASLVTLSACRTGLGKLTRGEGVIGLSRALIYAGARNIIVSFWNVADASTAELMNSFYRYMIDNPAAGFSGNLRLAKLDLIHGKKYAAPYYWAPFILIGH